MNFNVQEIEEQFRQENFPIIYEWHDDAGIVYPEHAHQGRVSFLVIKGSITFSGGIEKVVFAGERIDVPVGVIHSAIVGVDGCDYIVAQDIEGDA